MASTLSKSFAQLRILPAVLARFHDRNLRLPLFQRGPAVSGKTEIAWYFFGVF